MSQSTGKESSAPNDFICTVSETRIVISAVFPKPKTLSIDQIQKIFKACTKAFGVNHEVETFLVRAELDFEPFDDTLIMHIRYDLRVGNFKELDSVVNRNVKKAQADALAIMKHLRQLLYRILSSSTKSAK